MSKKQVKRTTLKNIWDWSKQQHLSIGVLTIADMLAAVLAIWFSMSCREIVDYAVARDNVHFTRYIIILTGILFVQLVLRYSANMLNERTKAALNKEMRRDVLHQLLKKQYASVKPYHSGELVNRLFSDVDIITNCMVDFAPAIAGFVMRMAGAVIVLWQMDSWFTGIFLMALLMIYFVVRRLREYTKNLHRRVQEKKGIVQASMQEIIENIRLIKAAEAEHCMEQRVEQNQQAYYVTQMKQKLFAVATGTGMTFLAEAGRLSALVWGCIGIFRQTLSYGTLMAMIQLVGQIQMPLVNLSGVLQKFYAMLASAERVEEIYLLPNEADAEHTAECGSLQRILIQNIDFSYSSRIHENERDEILRNVSLTVERGDCMAITGMSGGGKSTLFLLLLGIYQPDAGKIICQTEDEMLPVSKQTRKLFAYVPQGNILFSGSIRENIAMFRENATDDEIWKAAEIACIRSFIEEAGGLDAMLGERGIGLSEGQAQRIAVARGILSDAPVLLLDEATSALDEQTEAQLIQNISALSEKTCLIVTHRPAALSICNKQAVITNGSAEVFLQKNI